MWVSEGGGNDSYGHIICSIYQPYPTLQSATLRKWERNSFLK